ncbi:hypothetical protein EUTSA_v10023041mg [Eutrema salsugineum]|uniref:UBC core domain-containing protein n=1 Tax=Eutrema salsugineum TaxID=72664 RepID=V4M7V2_EUTSA|nr:hypothetical protein EUTSA_v10023041mg [Eutrema salsugineum]
MASKMWIQTHLRELLRSPASGFSVGPVEDDMYEWQATLMGPPGSPYEGNLFFLSLCFPLEYPFRPPTVSWKTPILHPNIDYPRVFHPLLELLQALYDMLLHPKVEEGDVYLVEIARMFVLEKEKYEEEARRLTKASR